MFTEHQLIVNALANTGRRYSIDVGPEGSTITDEGVCNGRWARPTLFRCDPKGKFLSVSRPLKGAWLLRGELKIWG